MKKSRSGFSLIELVVVVVIIGILAGITLITYRGATERANDTQTISAANQWMKALQMYRARNGSLPNIAGCLGSGYMFNYDGKGTTGTGQCRQDAASYGVTENTALNQALAPYISTKPTPSMKTTAVNSPTAWYRGLYYYTYPDPSNSGKTFARIDVVLSSAGTCPTSLGGITGYAAGTTADKNHVCHYSFGDISSYK